MQARKRIRRGERWTLSELRQLGKVPDSVLARRFGRTIKEIVAEREHRGIARETGPRRWTAREIRLLGEMNDKEVSRRLRRTYEDVRKQRISFHIPALRPLRHKKWTLREEKLLGTMPDKELARSLDRSVASVKAHRIALGLRKYSLSSRWWKAEEEKLLGTASDREIATRLGRNVPGVTARRRLLGIPPAPTIRPDSWTATEDRLLGTATTTLAARALLDGTRKRNRPQSFQSRSRPPASAQPQQCWRAPANPGPQPDCAPGLDGCRRWAIPYAQR